MSIKKSCETSQYLSVAELKNNTNHQKAMMLQNDLRINVNRVNRMLLSDSVSVNALKDSIQAVKDTTSELEYVVLESIVEYYQTEVAA